MVGSTMPVNLTSPTPSARPCPGAPSQPRKKPSQLPQRVEAEAARHHRIALEMAGEEPEVGLATSSSATIWPLPCAPPVSVIVRDAVEHQHRRQRQLRVAGAEQLAAPAGQQILVVELVPPLCHRSFRLFPLGMRTSRTRAVS